MNTLIFFSFLFTVEITQMMYNSLFKLRLITVYVNLGGNYGITISNQEATDSCADQLIESNRNI